METPQEIIGSVYALGAALSWAISVNLFKRGAERVHPAALNLFKSTLALLFFTPIVLLSEWTLTSIDFWSLIGSGFIGISVADTLFFWALRRISTSQMAVMDCLFSPWVIFLSGVLLGETLGATDAAGGLLIIASMLLARNPGIKGLPGSGNSSQNSWGLVGAAVSIGLMGLSVVIVKPILEEQEVSVTTAVRLLGACAGLVLTMWFRTLPWLAFAGPKDRGWTDLVHLLKPQPLWKTLLPATLLGNCLSLYLWIGGYKYLQAHAAALLNQMSTPFILIVAVLFFREQLTLRSSLALGLAFSGCLLVLL